MADIIDIAIDSAAAEEREIEEDSDAVVSPVLWLLMLADKVLASPVYVWVGVALGILYSVSNITSIDADATRLVALSRVCFGLMFFLFSLPLFSLRRVARKTGVLAQLGVGSVKISARAGKRLKYWQIFMVVFMWSPMGAFPNGGWYYVFDKGIKGNPDDVVPMFLLRPGETSLVAVQRAEAWVQGLWHIFVRPWVIWVWYLALKEASILVSDEVTELRKSIRDTSVKSASWDAEVVPAALSLIQKTLPVLSAGFSDGLFAITAACWTGSLGNFATFLDEEANGSEGSSWFYLLGVIGLSCLPLLVAGDVATASSDCDAILTALNEKRQESMLDFETDAKLQILERTLKQENRGGGIGFVVGHMVVDKRTLGTILVGMSGILGTIVPVVLALQPTARNIGESACSLSAAQITIIQGALAISNGNSTSASCSFNQTLNEVLVM